MKYKTQVLLKGDTEFKWIGEEITPGLDCELITDNRILTDKEEEAHLFSFYSENTIKGYDLEYCKPVHTFRRFPLGANYFAEVTRNPYKLALGIEEFYIARKVNLT